MEASQAQAANFRHRICPTVLDHRWQHRIYRFYKSMELKARMPQRS